MSNNAATHMEHASSWQLQAEFSATSLRGGDRKLADQVTETVQALGLHSRQLERIQQAVMEAVQRASLHGQPAAPISPVHIRIWVVGDWACGRGWGFFVVEKPGSAPKGVPAETAYLVELFLYQERDWY